jgi:hypothetical protein
MFQHTHNMDHYHIANQAFSNQSAQFWYHTPPPQKGATGLTIDPTALNAYTNPQTSYPYTGGWVSFANPGTRTPNTTARGAVWTNFVTFTAALPVAMNIIQPTIILNKIIYTGRG